MSTFKINHVAIVLDDVEQGLSFWRDALGLPLEGVEDNEAEAVTTAFLPLASGEIELIAPITEDSGVRKYLDKRGPGLHHICIEVDDIEACMAQLKAKAVQLITDEPKTRDNGTQYAFVHPKSTGGVLLELYALPK